jgi:hypothetical protein
MKVIQRTSKGAAWNLSALLIVLQAVGKGISNRTANPKYKTT